MQSYLRRSWKPDNGTRAACSIQPKEPARKVSEIEPSNLPKVSAKVAAKCMKYEDDKYYHIYNRGAHKAPLYLNKEHYRYCMRLIDNYFSQYRVSIEAYCLMPNHYHMLVRQMEGGSISRFIQTIFNAYVQGFNVQTEHGGTLFQGKAKAIEVDSDEYAVRLCRYIRLNPVFAGLVSTPEQWEWSDFRKWIDDRSDTPSNLSNLRKGSKLKPSDLPKVSAKASLRDIYFESGKAYAEFVSLGQEERELKKYLLE